MEAVQQFPGDGHGFVPQFSRDMLLPLLSTDAPSTPGRLDGRHHDSHDSVVAPIADGVLSRVVPTAREYDHGQVLASRGPVNGVLYDTGQQPVRADQESFHALAPRCNDLRIMDQLEELRGCDKRLTACMLDRLGDLRC